MSRLTIPEGWINTASWLIFLQGDYDTVERYLFSPELTGESRERGFNSFLALQHLTIHFWHAISTSFLFFYSVDYVALCLQAISDFADSQKRYADIPVAKFEPEFAKLIERLQGSDAELTAWLEAADAKLRSGSWHRWERTEPVPNLTTTALQLIEDCAALCSYRICYPSPSHEDFLHGVDRHHSAGHRVSPGAAYLLATNVLGDIAFDLFAPACYLALHAEDPGRLLEAILFHAKEQLHAASREQIIEDPLTFLLTGTNKREEDFFPLAIREAMLQGSPMPSHPILQPYIEKFAQAPDDLRLSDFFARPYYYRTTDGSRGDKRLEKHKEFLTELLPPAQVYAKDVGSLLRAGLGKRLGNEYTQKIAELTAIISLAERLVLGKRGHMFCPHQMCPIHKTALCQGYFAFPDSDYRTCWFPESLKDSSLRGLFESILS